MAIPQKGEVTIQKKEKAYGERGWAIQDNLKRGNDAYK